MVKMLSQTDINERLLESLDRLHLRLDTIERLLENKNPSESSTILKKNNPANHGATRTSEQEEWMLNAIAKNMSIDKIAEKMERTRGGIRARLLIIARKMVVNDNKSFEEASKATSLTVEYIKTGKVF